MQDRPTAAELLEVARSFLSDDVLDELSGRRRFHTRVLINVLGILEREVASGDRATRAEWRRFTALLDMDEPEPGPADELVTRVTDLRSHLSLRIREGGFDDRWDEARDAVYAVVEDKLRIANPGYAEDPSPA